MLEDIHGRSSFDGIMSWNDSNLNMVFVSN